MSTQRSPVPTVLRSSSPPASVPQQDFIRSLLAKREVPEFGGISGEERIANAHALLDAEPCGMTMRQASKTIEWLKTLPKREGNVKTNRNTSSEEMSFRTWPDLPDGRYALLMPEDEVNPIHFFTVRTSDFGDKWDGYQNLKRHVSDDRIKVSNKIRVEVMERLNENPKEASLLFGRETEHCGVCGRELTRPESREAGIGPVCAEKTGW